MRAFLIKTVLFMLPLAMIIAPPLVVLGLSGEYYPVRSLVALSQSAHRILIAEGYSNYVQEYQYTEVVDRTPALVFLGTSRVGEFRSVFVADPNQAYNAAHSVAALSDFRHFIQDVPTPPQVVVAGMDQYFFDPADAKNTTITRPDPFTTHSAWWDPFFESLFRNVGWMKVYGDYAQDKFDFSQVFAPAADPTLIGLRARATGDGTTNDGSDYYGSIITSTDKQSKALKSIHTLAAAISEVSGDEYGDSISPEALAEVRAFLAAARERHVTVIGFLPPVSHEVYTKLRQHAEAPYADTVSTLGPTLQALYREFGYDFYDFSDITTFNSSDGEMVEAKHGGEKMYLRMFITMAHASPALRTLTDLPYLERQLASSTSQYAVFGLQK